MEKDMVMGNEMAGIDNENIPCSVCLKASGDTVLKNVNVALPGMSIIVAAIIPSTSIDSTVSTYNIAFESSGADPPSHVLTIVKSTVFLT